MRAPPEAHTIMTGRDSAVARSIRRVIFSPTTEPILPPMNLKSITPSAIGIPFN
uniref:ORF53e n=1 Tax=Pinus koraiensis TaxID=88728 RepID=A4QMJ5_PINKO|nr:ORF53e [Pinus koraiensis]